VSHKIHPIAFQRDDRVESIKISTGWIVRYISGLCWFYHPQQKEWIINTAIELHGGLDSFASSYEESMYILNTIELPKVHTRAPIPKNSRL
jgi:hypothetical protein